MPRGIQKGARRAGLAFTLGSSLPRLLATVALTVVGFNACGKAGEDRGSEVGAGSPSVLTGGAAGAAGRTVEISGSSGEAPGGAAGDAPAGAGGTEPPNSGGQLSGGGSLADGGVATDGGSGGGSTPILPEERLVAAFCQATRTCCSASGYTLAPLDACEAQAQEQIEPLRLAMLGRIILDAAALERCIAAYALAATDCTMPNLTNDCAGLFRGTRAIGQPCDSFIECDRTGGPVYCVKDLAGATTGTCRRAQPGELGAACFASCGPSDECSQTVTSSDPTTVGALCLEKDGLYCDYGEGCAPLVADASECSWNDACGSNGFCSTVCMKRAGPGEVCQYNYGCNKGLSCVAARCAAAPLQNAALCSGALSEGPLQ